MGDVAQSVRLRYFTALVVTIPGLLLLIRVLTGRVEWYGWGWQMFS